MSAEHEHDEAPYWNGERRLATLLVDHREREISLRSHIESERYRGLGSETLFPLQHQVGERTYVQSRFIVPAPAGLGREWRLADAQAWLYSAETPPVVVFWELVSASPLW